MIADAICACGEPAEKWVGTKASAMHLCRRCYAAHRRQRETRRTNTPTGAIFKPKWQEMLERVSERDVS